MHNPAAHDAVIGHADPREEAQRHYETFQPYSWLEHKKKQGAFVLSMIICALMIVVALNGAFFKLKMLEEVLWWMFGVWGVLFFTFLITMVVLGRKRAKLYAQEHPNYAYQLR